MKKQFITFFRLLSWIMIITFALAMIHTAEISVDAAEATGDSVGVSYEDESTVAALCESVSEDAEDNSEDETGNNGNDSFNGKMLLPTTVDTPSDNCQLLGINGTYYSDAQDAVDRINEIRLEACKAGNVPDPRDKSRMLTEDDYVPIKWSTGLEKIARIRAVEASLSVGHSRLNGTSIWTVTYDGMSSSAEDLAWNYSTKMVYGINQFYEEKADWVNQTEGAVTGHYTSMINPNFKYVGLGDFYDLSGNVHYPNTLAAALSGTDKTGSDFLSAYSDIIQTVEVNNDNINGNIISGPEEVFSGREMQLSALVSTKYNSGKANLLYLGEVTYSSSDESIIKVTSSGYMTAIKEGKATITAISGDSVFATREITVACDHDYVYGDPDSEGKATGICSKCSATISDVIVPTGFKLFWRDNSSSSSYYSSTPIKEVNAGGGFGVWINAVTPSNADYDGFIIKSSDESVLSAPADPVGLKIVQIDALKAGEATLTIYPKTNKKLAKTFTIKVTGKSGSDDPDEPGDDHTHTEVVDKAVEPTCTEKGLTEGSHCDTCGKVIKEQQEVPAKGHTVVEDKEVSPTCTEKGKTAGSHCSVCNKVLKAQEEIKATGHSFDEGVVTKEPTYTEEGIKTYTCTVCKATEQKKIDRIEKPSVKISIGDKKYTIFIEIRDSEENVLSGIDISDKITVKGKKVVLAKSKSMKLKGYTFKGWKLDGKKITSIKTVNVTDNMTLVALFSENTYDIVYKLTKPAEGVKVMGKIPAFKKNKYTKEVILSSGSELTVNGYRLIGWTKEKKGTRIQYEPGATVQSLTEKNKGKVVLYPVWEKVD